MVDQCYESGQMFTKCSHLTYSKIETPVMKETKHENIQVTFISGILLPYIFSILQSI